MILEKTENLVDVSNIHEDPEAKPGPLEVCKAESCNHIRWYNLHTQSLEHSEVCKIFHTYLLATWPHNVMCTISILQHLPFQQAADWANLTISILHSENKTFLLFKEKLKLPWWQFVELQREHAAQVPSSRTRILVQHNMVSVSDLIHTD